MFDRLRKSRLGLFLLVLSLFLGWLGVRYGMAVVNARRFNAENIKFPEIAKVVQKPAAMMCLDSDSLVVSVGFMSKGARDSFLVTEIHVKKNGKQINFFGFRSPRDVMNHESSGGGTLKFPVKAVDTIEIARLLREFSAYSPDEKNLTPDSSNATLMLSFCGEGYSKYLDYTYGEWNHRRTRSLMRASLDVWHVNIGDSLADNVMRRAAAEIHSCSFWEEGIDEYWLVYELIGLGVWALVLSPLLFFVILPIIYVSIAKKPGEYIGICLCVFVVLQSISGIAMWNSNDEFDLRILMLPFVMQTVVWGICHVVWRYGYRNDSSESKKSTPRNK